LTPKVARIAVVPVLAVVARPFDAVSLEISATSSSLELHVTAEVRSCVV